MIKISRRSDLAIGALVLTISTMLLIPLPTFLLDFFITFNLAISLLLLLVGLYMPNPLALLSFPSLLLLSTLFRLGLNVASSRLILSQGEAGQVIEAFGTLLIRGQIVVGVIIFSIVTIVNFIVVARGSSRVSEVAARFALDALPGKQMAIDADLRAGILSPEQARLRREELQKESQLFGSMDGAMRFVQGDAIAGVFIIFANIIGGLFIGIQNGLSFAEAIETYTKLTVGDGLVTQIPALLVSICAGVVVTRVSSNEHSTLGSDVSLQLFARPGTLYVTGGIIGVIGLLPGLPTIPFLTAAAMMIGGAALVDRERQGFQSRNQIEYSGGSKPLLGNTRGEEVEGGSRLVIFLDSTVLYRIYRADLQRYMNRWKEFQDDFFQELGFRLPDLLVLPDDRLLSSHYVIRYGSTIIDEGSTLSDALLVESHPESASLFGLKVTLEETHPLSESRIFWTPSSQGSKKVLEASGIRTYDFFDLLCFKTGVFFQRHPEEGLTLTDVYSLLKGLEKKYPGLVEEGLHKSGVDASQLTELLQHLVREGLSIRDFKSVVEQVAIYASRNRSRISAEDPVNVEQLVSFIRIHRRKQILGGILAGRGTMKAFVVSDEVQEVIGQSTVSNGGGLSVDPEVAEHLLESYRQFIKPMKQHGVYPIFVLCRSEVRSKISDFFRGAGWHEQVLSFEELEPSLEIEQVGLWTIG